MKLAQLIIGIIITLICFSYGSIRIALVPKGLNFTGAAVIRWLIIGLAGTAGGVSLIIFSQI